MKTEFYVLVILLSVVTTESQTLCNNGVFKCVSPTSLRICFRDNLVTSEFFCPNSTFCNENSPTICSRIPAALPGIQYLNESVTTEEIYPKLECPESGIFKVEDTGCTTYLNCTNFDETEESECNEVSLFNPETSECDEDYFCPENLDFVQNYMDCSQTENNFICPKAGNFPLPNVNCERYILCKKIYIGMKAIPKVCPTNTLYDPSARRCVKGHICDDQCATTPEPTTTTPEPITTTVEPTTVTPETTTTPGDSPVCSGVNGKFPIPNTNCTKYILCTLLTNGTMMQKEYTCPAGYYFNPNTKRCSTTYECWPQTTTIPGPASSSSTEEPTTSSAKEPTTTSSGDSSVSTQEATTTSSEDFSSSTIEGTSTSSEDTSSSTQEATTTSSVDTSTSTQEVTTTSSEDSSVSTQEATTNSLEDSSSSTQEAITTPPGDISSSTEEPTTSSEDTSISTQEATSTSSEDSSSSTQEAITTPSEETSSSTQEAITTSSEDPSSSTQEATTTSSEDSSSSTQEAITTPSEDPSSSTQEAITTSSEDYSSSTQEGTTSSSEDTSSSTQEAITTPSEDPFSSTQEAITTSSEDPSSSTQEETTTSSEDSSSSTQEGTSTSSEDTSSSTQEAITTSSEDPSSSTQEAITTSSEEFSSSTLEETTTEDISSSTQEATTTSSEETSSSTQEAITTSSGDISSSTEETTTYSEDISTSTQEATTTSSEDASSSTQEVITTSPENISSSTEGPTTSSEDISSSTQEATTTSSEETSSSTQEAITTSSGDISSSTEETTTSSEDISTSTQEATTTSSEDSSSSTQEVITTSPGNISSSTEGPTTSSEDTSSSTQESITTSSEDSSSSTQEGTTTSSENTSSSTQEATTTSSEGTSSSTEEPTTSSEDISTSTTQEATTTSPADISRSTEEPTTSSEDTSSSTQEATTTSSEDTSSSTQEVTTTSSEDTSTQEVTTTFSEDSSTLTQEATTTSSADNTSSTEESTTSSADTSSSTEEAPTSTDISSSTEEAPTSTDISSTTDNNNEPTTPLIDCRSQGRLPVLNTKCKMYYQCTLTTNGYKYKMFECSEGTLFDSYKQICLKDYICPETTTTPADTTTTEADESSEEVIELNCTQHGKVPVPNTDCIVYGQCTLTTNGFIESTYECPEGTLYDPELEMCSDKYICPETLTTSTSMESTTSSSAVPSCSQQGKLPVPNTKCKNYLSCILTSNGFVSTEYACSGKLVFDPILKKCSSNYICNEVISTFPLIQEVDCTTAGRFPVPHSNCSQYIMCVSTESGFRSKIYTCPSSSHYNPDSTRCSTTYSCPDLLEPTEEPPLTTSPECVQTGKYSIPNTGCSQYILCSLTSLGFKSKVYSCPIDTYFNPEMKRCQKEYICPELTETTTEHEDSEDSEDSEDPEDPEECVNLQKELPVCLKPGKFSITGTNCNQYILCTQTSLGFRSKVYECPNDSNFDPIKKKCSISYECTEKLCSTKPVKTVQKPVKTVQKPLVSKCKYSGKFPIPGTTCKKFKLCVWTSRGYTKTVYDCPKGTAFNPRTQLCSKHYICSEDKTYNCTTIGQFKDSTDHTCQFYINCKTTADGSIRGQRKQCPNDYYFDPVIQKCSAYFICKVNRFARLVGQTPKFLVNNQCTTIGRYTIPGTNCKNYMYCADNGGGTLKGTQFVCPTTSVFNQAIQKCTASYICPDSVCNFLGKQPNTNSKDCTSYIECDEHWNAVTGAVWWTGRVVFCPIGQKFDPGMQCCSSDYICP